MAKKNDSPPETAEADTPKPGAGGANRPGHGVLVRAANGEVIRYDPSGLVLRLSDKVIADISLRLGLRQQGVAAPDADAPQHSADPHEHLEGIDAWDLRVVGDWLHFTAHLPGRQGVRGFRRLSDGGAIIADAPGPLFGVLGLGGPRAAQASPERATFPQHILAPADDIGAVGHAGVERAGEVDRLEHLREMTHEALLAETLLEWQLEKYEALPLFMTRVETDSSPSVTALAESVAFDNMIAAAANLARAAARMGKTPKLLCICLDFALEDMSSDAHAYRDGMLDLMRRAEEALAGLGFARPLFVARFESGSAEVTGSPALEGQWELAWKHGDFDFRYSAPGYMFPLDAYDRPTRDGRREMAEMSALAVSAKDGWRCPTLHLAERSPSEPALIRVVAQAMEDLVIDDADPFGAGPHAGFRLIGAENDAKITSVEIDPADPKTLRITCDRPPEGSDLRLAYAWGAEPRDTVKKTKSTRTRKSASPRYPANCGALRDGWHHRAATGRDLYRWALPCVLPVHEGGAND